MTAVGLNVLFMENVSILKAFYSIDACGSAISDRMRFFAIIFAIYFGKMY